MGGRTLGPRPLKGWVTGGIGVLSFFMVTLIPGLYCELPFQTCTSHHQNKISKRSVSPPPIDKCLRDFGGIELNYTLGSTTAFQIDLCTVINCGDEFIYFAEVDFYLGTNQQTSVYCTDNTTNRVTESGNPL
ncbi:hypothetical protein XENOCAPTIV_002989 [Xenoophorus captivus]|uniref:Uncharacterized protein n=1 Tax=Xenoophorus captivus TaxID=1517983 RepID=A0ABV0Q7P7_9TELE